MIQIGRNKALLFSFSLVFIFSCNLDKQTETAHGIALGKWRGVLELSNNSLPFLFEVKDTVGSYQFEISNGDERIFVDEIILKGDSFFIKLPVFDSEIRGKTTGDELIGNWYNNARTENNVIPFKANHAVIKRFEAKNKPNHNITGRWEIGFYNPSESGDFMVHKAIGEFMQKDEIVTGTIITPTGDYRYLEGIVDGDEVVFSSFNGAHAFLFKAKIENNRLEGDFWSGLHWSEKWLAEPNDNFTLPDADSLTFLNNGFTEIDFSFPNLSGKQTSFKDNKYNNKVVIVQIMGSWCPNCLDETAFLNQLYKEYNNKGLEIIALAYETSSDFNKAKTNVERLVKKANAQYDFLIAGTSSKKAASQTLPFLNHVMAFPTTIFVDKKGNVRKIHTGFTGPGTGNYYNKYVEQTTFFVDKLLSE
ncbi:MAG: TlpA family protein disulfide reductase [Bacteroidetes bacterium]|nr:TlpA family protein disulfide reductase [Bacteroidota bacterium]HET6244388.1 TlpA disulfide reductase family protein [Bacteroidia bacterium]